MKQTNLLCAAALCAAVLSSCRMEQATDVKVMHGGKVEMQIDISNTVKAALNPANEAKVNNLQVLVFRSSDGVLDAYGTGTSASLPLKCSLGQMKIYAVANAPTLSDVGTEAELKGKVHSLGENAPDNFIMIGSLSHNVITGGTVTISVKRIVARIGIARITNDMTAPAQQGKEFKIKAIYVVNVPGAATYGVPSSPTVWFNKMRHENELSELTYAAVPDATSGIAYKGSYTTGHYFYVYPNDCLTDSQSAIWSPRATRLTIEATLGGVTCYYPLIFTDGTGKQLKLEPNKTYTVNNLTIHRIGSGSPDTPVVVADCTFNIQVQDWELGIAKDMEI